MPRPDGRLYEFEKAALKKEADKGKPKVKLGRPPKPKTDPVIEPKPEKERHELAPVEGKAGRPTVRKRLTRADIDGVLGHIAEGLSIESSLALVGVSRAVVDKWRKLNPSLQLEFEKAEHAWEKKLVGNINRFANDDLKAASWLLERRLPTRWAPISKTELTGKDGGAIIGVSQVLLSSVANGGAGKEKVRERRIKTVKPSVEDTKSPIDVTTTTT